MQAGPNTTPFEDESLDVIYGDTDEDDRDEEQEEEKDDE